LEHRVTRGNKETQVLRVRQDLKAGLDLLEPMEDLDLKETW
jgi:hypothetical protein